jgi:hypothetical protein
MRPRPVGGVENRQSFAGFPRDCGRRVRWRRPQARHRPWATRRASEASSNGERGRLPLSQCLKRAPSLTTSGGRKPDPWGFSAPPTSRTRRRRGCGQWRASTAARGRSMASAAPYRSTTGGAERPDQASHCASCGVVRTAASSQFIPRDLRPTVGGGSRHSLPQPARGRASR